MKKNVCIAVCLAATLALLATACHDVIFYEIRQEVELTDGQVPGDIRSIVEFKNNLYVENGNIYRKPKNASSYGQWVKLSRDGMGGGKVFKLAAGDKLYALAGHVRSDEDEGENYVNGWGLFCSDDGNSWKPVGGSYSLSTTGNHLYSLTDGSSVSAYIRNNSGTIYSLSGGSVGNDGKPYKIKAGDYTASGSAINGHSVGSTIYSMALAGDHLVVGTASGLKYINTNNWREETVANSASALSSYYEVHCVFVVDPDKSPWQTDTYASAIFSGTTSSGASSKNEGLWAYYPGRGNWNRE